MALKVELVSPEGTVYSGDASTLILRTVGGGDIAFMDGHAPFVGALEIATATIVTDVGEEQVAVHGGFVEVTTHPDASAPSGAEAAAAGDPSGTGATTTIATILSDVAERAGDIDVGRARQAKERAESKLRGEGDADAQAALRRAHMRLAAADAL